MRWLYVTGKKFKEQAPILKQIEWGIYLNHSYKKT